MPAPPVTVLASSTVSGGHESAHASTQVGSPCASGTNRYSVMPSAFVRILPSGEAATSPGDSAAGAVVVGAVVGGGSPSFKAARACWKAAIVAASTAPVA